MKQMFHLTKYFKANPRVATTSAKDENIGSTQQPRDSVRTHLPLPRDHFLLLSVVVCSLTGVVVSVSELDINRLVCYIFGFFQLTWRCLYDSSWGWCSHSPFILIVVKRLLLWEGRSPSTCPPSPGLTGCSALQALGNLRHGDMAEPHSSLRPGWAGSSADRSHNEECWGRTEPKL